jgi:hypothetical protein
VTNTRKEFPLCGTLNFDASISRAVRQHLVRPKIASAGIIRSVDGMLAHKRRRGHIDFALQEPSFAESEEELTG